MSQKLCPQCQTRVLLDASTCPGCGHAFPADPGLTLLRPGAFEKHARIRPQIPLKGWLFFGGFLAVILIVGGTFVYQRVSQIELKSVWNGGRFKNREKAREYGLNDTEMVIVGHWQGSDGQVYQFFPDKTGATQGDEGISWTWRAEPGKYFHLPEGDVQEEEVALDLGENTLNAHGETMDLNLRRIE